MGAFWYDFDFVYVYRDIYALHLLITSPSAYSIQTLHKITINAKIATLRQLPNPPNKCYLPNPSFNQMQAYPNLSPALGSQTPACGCCCFFPSPPWAGDPPNRIPICGFHIPATGPGWSGGCCCCCWGCGGGAGLRVAMGAGIGSSRCEREEWEECACCAGCCCCCCAWFCSDKDERGGSERSLQTR